MSILNFVGKSLKSKTIGVNALGTLILAVCGYFGYTPDPDVVPIVYMVGNIGMRFLTKEAISDKKLKGE